MLITALGAVLVTPRSCAAEVCIYPVNAFYFRMIHPDGTEQMFQRTGFGGETLVGERGWAGRVNGRTIHVESPHAEGGGQIERYDFKNGLPAGAAGKPKERRGVKSLFPSAQKKQLLVEEFARRADTWRGTERLRFFSKNPNVSGLIAAELAILLVGLVFVLRPVALRIVAGAGAASMLGLLLMTESRSALLAFLAGCFAVMLPHVRRWLSWRRLIVVVLVLGLVLATLLTFHIGDRFTRQIVTNSAADTLRMDILKAVPSMVADSPSGVGLGNAGAIFTAWYDDAEAPRPYRTLISSHLTWFVEFGTVGRFLYLCGWSLVLGALLFGLFHGFSPLPLALWGCLFVAGFFNPVYESAWVWILPLVFLIAGLCPLRSVRPKAAFSIVGASVALAVLVLTGVVFWGRGHRQSQPLSIDAQRVLVNGTDPDVWIVGDEFVVGGWTFVGREFFEHYIEYPDSAAIGYVESVDFLPPTVKRLVLTGESAARYLEAWKDAGRRKGLCKAEAILLLSPAVSLGDTPPDLVSSVRIRAVVGSLAARMDDSYDSNDIPAWVRIVKGALLYIPRWVVLSQNF